MSWVKNVKPGDTPRTAKQRLRVVKDGVTCNFTPKGGFILDFGEFVDSGVSVLSADAEGGRWLERFDLETNRVIARFLLREPPPNPFPDWATSFRGRWED